METSDKNIELPLLDKTRRADKDDNYSCFPDFVEPSKKEERFKPMGSYFQIYTFLDVLPTTKELAKTEKRIIPPEMLPLPYSEEYNIEEKAFVLDKEWREEVKKPEPSLLSALYRTFKTEWYWRGFFSFLVGQTQFLSSILMGKMMNLITQKNLGDSVPLSETLSIAIVFAVVYFANQYLETLFFYLFQTMASRAKFSMMNLMYKKLNCVALNSLQQLNLGKVLNLMANDLNDMDSNGSGSMFVWPLLTSPYFLVFAIYLIWGEFGGYTLICFGVQVGFIMLSTYLTAKSKGQRAEKNRITDRRVKYTNELIECIRLIKLYAWEKPFQKVIEKFRLQEAQAWIKLSRIEAIGKPIAETSVSICIFLTCIFYVWGGGVLSPAKVYFTSTALVFLKRRVLMAAHQGRIYVVNFKLMMQRIADVLKVKDILSLKDKLKKRNEDEEETYTKFKDIKITNFTANWLKNSSTPTLDNLNLTIQSGKVTAVIGKIGSGKTTLLLSFLNEVPYTSGRIICDGNIDRKSVV